MEVNIVWAWNLVACICHDFSKHVLNLEPSCIYMSHTSFLFFPTPLSGIRLGCCCCILHFFFSFWLTSWSSDRMLKVWCPFLLRQRRLGILWLMTKKLSILTRLGWSWILKVLLIQQQPSLIRLSREAGLGYTAKYWFFPK